MRVKEEKIENIKPYEQNPRKNDAAVARVAASIRDFGFKQPIVVDKDKIVIAGHTRLLAAISLGMKTVPVVVADDLTEDEARAYRLADNKTAEFAEWDADLLLAELASVDMDMTEYGFDMAAAGDFYSDDDHLHEQGAPSVRGGGTECTCPQCGFTFEV